jgi:hypothetical protein
MHMLIYIDKHKYTIVAIDLDKCANVQMCYRFRQICKSCYRFRLICTVKVALDLDKYVDAA